jgi:hypothetical protein
MHRAVLLVLVCVAALAGLARGAPVQYVTRSLPSPLLAWSGRSLLAGKNVYSSLSSDSVMSALDALLGKGTLSPLVKGKDVPELILICGVQVRLYELVSAVVLPDADLTCGTVFLGSS